jgi:hypothetical protein
MAVQTYDDVSKDEVGTVVQDYIDAGAKKVTVTPNLDGETCTVVVTTSKPRKQP